MKRPVYEALRGAQKDFPISFYSAGQSGRFIDSSFESLVAEHGPKKLDVAYGTIYF